MTTYDQRNVFDIHQYQWSFIDQPTEDDLCCQCAKILIEPMLTECCGIHLCRACVEPSFIKGKLNECPGCNQLYITCILDRPKWKNILRLKVICPMKERGCQWNGDIQSSHDHLTVDCKQIDFECRNGCGESLERHEIADHLENACPKRSLACQYCNQVGASENIVGDHLLICSEYIIPCPNGCGEQMKQSWYYNRHSEDCTKLIVPCPFNFVGCSTLSERRFMPQHLIEDNQNHAHLQWKFVCNKLEKTNNEFLQQMEVSERLYKYYQEVSKTNADEMRESIERQIERTTSRRSQKVENSTKKSIQRIVNCENRFEQTHKHLENTVKTLFTKAPNTLWEINHKVVQFEIKLHSGQFSEIWKGLHHQKHQVAIKKHKTGSTTPLKFLQEANILSTLHHCNILKLYGVGTSEEPLLIVTEYVIYGNLIDFFNSTERENFSVSLKMIEQVASGMAYLENENCIHRCITSRSILIGDKFHCKIGSFSLARRLKEGEFEYQIPQGERVSIKWSAPEVLTENKYSVKSDIWSFGILQYEIMIHHTLKMSNSNLINTECNLKCPEECEEEHYKLVVQCWSGNPDLRPSICMFLNLHTAIYNVADVDKLAEIKKVDSSLDLKYNKEIYREPEGVPVQSELPREDNSEKQGPGEDDDPNTIVEENPYDDPNEEDPDDNPNTIDEENPCDNPNDEDPDDNPNTIGEENPYDDPNEDDPDDNPRTIDEEDLYEEIYGYFGQPIV